MKRFGLLLLLISFITIANGQSMNSVKFTLPSSLNVNTIIVQQDTCDGALFIGFGKTITNEQIVQAKSNNEEVFNPNVQPSPQNVNEVFKFELPPELLDRLSIYQNEQNGTLEIGFNVRLDGKQIELVKKYVYYYYYELQPLQSKYNPYSPDVDLYKNCSYLRFYTIMDN